ncbi:MAG: extracellular solute-binding protein, partial [Eubacteriales bacterium]|nr:extracellular solute-binding protein [Eubacteriales bacterium]
MKKIISVILCCLITLTVIVSCSDNTNVNTADGVTTASDVQNEETEIMDNLPDSNFEGYTFTVLTIVDSIGIEEADGEVLNDAEYARDVKAEERFNIDIEAEFHENYAEVTAQFKKAVAAQTDDYDMVFIHMVEGASIASSGHYYPINDLEYIDIDKIWWDDDAENGFRIGGKLFLAAGDILPDTLLRTSCMAFNKNLFDNYNLTYPYQPAYDGKWTLDDLSALTKDITRDLNGDGQITEKDDLFGLTSWYLDSPYSFYYGAGGTIIKKDEYDMPELNLDIEKNLAIYMKIYDVVITNNSNYHTDINTYENAYSTFYEGRALFCEIALTHLSGDKWRNMEQDYGIVPIPKFDAEDGKST